MSGSASSAAKAFLAVMGKAEGELALADLAAKPADQRLEIGFVIDAEDFDRLGQSRASGEEAAEN